MQRSKLMTPLSDSAMATLKRCWSGVVIPLLFARDPRVFGHTLAGGEAGLPAGGGPGRMPLAGSTTCPLPGETGLAAGTRLHQPYGRPELRPTTQLPARCQTGCRFGVLGQLRTLPFFRGQRSHGPQPLAELEPGKNRRHYLSADHKTLGPFGVRHYGRRPVTWSSMPPHWVRRGGLARPQAPQGTRSCR
jgi:hypothetical protein